MSQNLDIASLLHPIDGDSPVGAEQRGGEYNLYYQLHDAGEDARKREKDNWLGDKEAIAQWKLICSEGPQFLTTVAKDLEISTLLLVASVRVGGIAALAPAIDLQTELIRSFWPDLYPRADEDGLETTLLPISQLDGIIEEVLKRIPITAETSVGECQVWHQEDSQRVQTIQEKDPNALERTLALGAVTPQTLHQAVAETRVEFYVSMTHDVQRVRESLQRLDDVLAEKVPEEFIPKLPAFERGLKLIEKAIRVLAEDRLAAALAAANDPTTDGSAAAAASGAASSGAAASVSGTAQSATAQPKVLTREDVINQLEKAAAWFEQHEPQSVLPSEIRKVVKRSKMNPRELLVDLIDDDSVRRSLFRDVGIAADAS